MWRPLIGGKEIGGVEERTDFYPTEKGQLRHTHRERDTLCLLMVGRDLICLLVVLLSSTVNVGLFLQKAASSASSAALDPSWVSLYSSLTYTHTSYARVVPCVCWSLSNSSSQWFPAVAEPTPLTHSPGHACVCVPGRPDVMPSIREPSQLCFVSVYDCVHSCVFPCPYPTQGRGGLMMPTAI